MNTNPMETLKSPRKITNYLNFMGQVTIDITTLVVCYELNIWRTELNLVDCELALVRG